jgi:hypothetical protein
MILILVYLSGDIVLGTGGDNNIYTTSGDGAIYDYADYGQDGNVCGDFSERNKSISLQPGTSEGGAFRSQHYASRRASPL